MASLRAQRLNCSRLFSSTSGGRLDSYTESLVTGTGPAGSLSTLSDTVDTLKEGELASGMDVPETLLPGAQGPPAHGVSRPSRLCTTPSHPN